MKPKTKTVLFILLSFVLGLSCGVFIDGRIGDRLFHEQRRGPRDFQKMLVEKLNLDQHQAVQLDSLLESKKSLINKQRKHMLAMRDSLQIDIKKILNSEQIKKFDEMILEMNRFEKKRMEESEQKK